MEIWKILPELLTHMAMPVLLNHIVLYNRLIDHPRRLQNVRVNTWKILKYVFATSAYARVGIF